MRYKDLVNEDEYGRDQGALNEPENARDEEEFMSWVKNDDLTLDRYKGEGFDSGQLRIEGNEVFMDERRMGSLSSVSGNIMVMHGDYSEGGQDADLIGAIKKGPKGIDVWFYATGYEGTSKDMKSALETLIIAAWS